MSYIKHLSLLALEFLKSISNGKKKDSPIGVGMTAKQMKRKRPINADLLNKIGPITDNQKVLFDNYKEGKNILPTVLLEQVKLLLRCILH